MSYIERLLKITDDLSEQIEIGRRLVVSYDKEMVKFIMSTFDKINDFEKRTNGISKENMLYKSAYDYWMYGFRPDQQFYYHLWLKTHEEKKTYLSQMKQMVYDAYSNRMEDMHYLEDKFEAYELLKPYYKREIIKIMSKEDFSKFSDFVSRHRQFVLKPLSLHDTYGIKKVDISTNSKPLEEIFLSIINPGKEFVGDYTTDGYGHVGAVLEEIVEQDSEFGKMSPKSLNVIRIGTLRAKGKIHLLGAYTKIGITDDLIVGESRDAIMAGVNLQTGVIETKGYYESGDTTDEHPVSHIKMIGFQFPKWDELLEMLNEVATNMISTINYIGWDVAYTPKGWVIIEGNFFGQHLWQIVYEHGTEKEVGDILGWHIEDDKYWWQYNKKKLQKEAGFA